MTHEMDADDEPIDAGRYRRPVSTASAAAQRWWERGLTWCYGYHHERAIGCFQRAAAADPGCAMAQWGIAYASGPNYNYPWRLHDPAGKARALAQARAATAAAVALAGRGGLTGPEAALVAALPARYPQDTPAEDQSGWDRDFAAAMREAHRAHPADPDIAAVFAESLLNLTPWQMWDLSTGQPAAGAATQEARRVLETAMARPGGMDHPGLTHLYVHLMEMSPEPEAALRAADRLRRLVPGAGHLVHMPSHIDVLCGAWADALQGNLDAVAADEALAEREGRLNFYTGYRLHNYHFAIYAAMFLGRYDAAMAAAEGLEATMPEAFLRIDSPPMADFFEAFRALKPHIWIRFGRWAEAAEAPLPADPDLYRMGTAMARYARGVARAALGEVEAALAEQEAFRAAAARVPPTRLLHNNRCVDLLGIAESMLAGEIDYRRRAYGPAFDHLREAVRREDTLPYDEPWGWMQPARHALGALLLEQGEAAEAEAVYRADLGLGGTLPRAQVHPDNVWALRGLLTCLERRGEQAEAVHVRARLRLAQARADGRVAVSCFCARGG
jgi:tetratricopeptide (TPR) repeat protein